MIGISSYAQCGGGCVWVGPKVGGNMSMLTSAGNSTAIEYGAEAGIFLTYSPSTWFALQAEAMYSLQRDKMHYEYLDTDVENRFQYINIPVLAKFYPVAGFNLQVGAQLGMLLDAKETLKCGTTKNTDDYKWYNIGIPVGLGYDFPFGLTVDARYIEGVNNIYKDKETQGTRRNRNVSLSIGWRF